MNKVVFLKIKINKLEKIILSKKTKSIHNFHKFNLKIKEKNKIRLKSIIEVFKMIIMRILNKMQIKKSIEVNNQG